MSPSRTVTFGRLCHGCPLRAACTTAKAGRSMTIHPHEDLLRAARAQVRTPQFKTDYPTRSNIERTVAHVVTQSFFHHLEQQRPSRSGPLMGSAQVKS